jgi:hypothetical protein
MLLNFFACSKLVVLGLDIESLLHKFSRVHTRMGEHQSNSPVSSRNRQASARTLKHISRIHPIQHLPFIYRQAYPCQMRARSIWLCSTAMDSKTEPLLLALITWQACSPHKRLVLFFLLLSNHERLKMRLRSMTPPRATRPISGLIQNATTTSMPIMPTATFLSNGRVMVVLLTFPHARAHLITPSRSAMFTTSLLSGTFWGTI